jgi:hypothetical protein
LAVALAGRLLFFGLAKFLFQQPVHHWHPLYSNLRAILETFSFQSLAEKSN